MPDTKRCLLEELYGKIKNMFHKHTSNYNLSFEQSAFFIGNGKKILSELHTPFISVDSLIKGLFEKTKNYHFNLTPIKQHATKREFDLAKSLEEVEGETYRKDYLVGVVSVIWGLYAMAQEEMGIDLERGSFTIVDPHNKLYEFFLGYVAFANKIVRSEIDQLSYRTANSLAYPRSSSHHKDYSQQQYGIDIRFAVNASLLHILPHGLTHILFYSLCINGQKCLVIKNETIGLGNKRDVLVHAINFSKFCVTSKHSAQCYRETDLPLDLLNTYTRFCQAIGKPLSKKKNLKIYEMWATIQETGILSNDLAIKAQKDFVKQALAHKMPIESLNLRIGKEVILMPFSSINLRVAVDKNPSSSSEQQYILSVNENGEQYIYSPEGVLPNITKYQDKFAYIDTINCSELDQEQSMQFMLDANRENFYVNTKEGILAVYNFEASKLIEFFCSNYLHVDTKEIFKNFLVQTFHQKGLVYMAEYCFCTSLGCNGFMVKIDRKPLYIDLSATDQIIPRVKIIEEFNIVQYSDLLVAGNLGNEHIPKLQPIIATIQFESEVNCTQFTNKFIPKRLLIKIIDPELAAKLFSKFISYKKISEKPESDVPIGLKSVELEQKIDALQPRHKRSLGIDQEQVRMVQVKEEAKSQEKPQQQNKKSLFNIALKILIGLTVIGGIVMLAIYLWNKFNSTTGGGSIQSELGSSSIEAAKLNSGSCEEVGIGAMVDAALSVSSCVLSHSIVQTFRKNPSAPSPDGGSGRSYPPTEQTTATASASTQVIADPLRVAPITPRKRSLI